METPKMDWPVDVSPFFNEAQKVVAAVLHAGVPIDSAILDDWNSGTDKNSVKLNGPRIIWGIEACSMNRCRGCKLFHRIGADVRSEIVQPSKARDLRGEHVLRKTLCRATKEHMSFLPEGCRQKYLNCKTVEQYKTAFVAFVMQCCDTAEKMHAELAWIFGFRLLYLNEECVGLDCDALLNKEREMKRKIIGAIMDKLVCARDVRRLRLMLVYEYKGRDFLEELLQ